MIKVQRIINNYTRGGEEEEEEGRHDQVEYMVPFIPHSI